MNYAARVIALLFIIAAALAVEIPVGHKATLSATYEANTPLTVEWFKDAIKIGEGAQYVIPSVASTDAGTYRALVTNSLGSADATAQIEVTSPIPSVPTATISSSFTGEVIATGVPFLLTATTTNLTAPTFQWIRDETYLPGATASTYAVAAATSSDAGLYSVVATAASGFVRSNGIAVIVSAPPPPITLPPTITVGPVSITVPKKGTARFTVTATGERIRYQWKKGLVDIPGATNATLTISNVKPPDAGSYIVTVSNDAGYVKAGATLSVR
jgi:hypothetical protein